MPNDKPAKPSIATFADHEVITPPNRLRDALSTSAGPTDDPVARAERALALLSGEFAGWMDAECERLHAARGALKAQGFHPQTHAALFHAAHDIKGQAATFGYPFVASLAASLCRLIEHTPDTASIPLTLVDQHVDAVRAVVRESQRPDIAVMAGALAQRLTEVTDEFLTRANCERPDYLDDIFAPPLAPGEPF
jgi:HPt (histidine-containing phosphotransfer) domain-containing protein